MTENNLPENYWGCLTKSSTPKEAKTIDLTKKKTFLTCLDHLMITDPSIDCSGEMKKNNFFNEEFLKVNIPMEESNIQLISQKDQSLYRFFNNLMLMFLETYKLSESSENLKNIFSFMEEKFVLSLLEKCDIKGLEQYFCSYLFSSSIYAKKVIKLFFDGKTNSRDHFIKRFNLDVKIFKGISEYFKNNYKAMGRYIVVIENEKK